jgi:hypothetical protein
VAGPSKGPDRHRRKKTPHPASPISGVRWTPSESRDRTSVAHPLPSEREKVNARNRALKTGSSLSEGRGWTAPRAFTSGRGAGEGSRARGRNPDSRICQAPAASPAEPGDLPTD